MRFSAALALNKETYWKCSKWKHLQPIKGTKLQIQLLLRDNSNNAFYKYSHYQNKLSNYKFTTITQHSPEKLTRTKQRIKIDTRKDQREKFYGGNKNKTKSGRRMKNRPFFHLVPGKNGAISEISSN